MSQVRLGPPGADGVMKRKALNMNNGAMKNLTIWLLFFYFIIIFFFYEMKLKVSDILN